MSGATSFEINTGAKTTASAKTVICYGTYRGGTSMVAGAILGLGVPMGEEERVNVEDLAFNIESFKGMPEAFHPAMRETIAQRNAAHEIWGWKYPNAVHYLDELRDSLRNPYLVCVYRDPVPALIREEQERTQVGELDFVANRLRLMRRNTLLIRDWGVPGLLVSYEKASARPETFLSELSGFLDLPLPENIAPILEFMAPGGYKVPKF